MSPIPRPHHLLCLALAALAPSSVEAATISVSFTGTILAVAPELASAFSTGQAVSGSLQLDSSTVDGFPADATLANYPGAASSFAFTFGSYSAANAAGGSLLLQNSGVDSFQTSSSCFSPCGPTAAGYALSELRLTLGDSSGTAFASDAFPTSLSLSAFDSEPFARNVMLRFDVGGSLKDVVGTVSMLSYTVPEPGALALLALGAAGIALRRRG